MHNSLPSVTRFLLLAVFFSVFHLCGASSEATAQSFSINGPRVFGPVVQQYNDIVSITNLAGKTQYLVVTVVNPDPTLQFEMLDLKSEIVPLGSSIVLFKDSTGFDHGTFIFRHPTPSSKPFTTLVIFTDASRTTSDTITFNINDSLPLPPKHVMSLSPQSPVTLLMGKEASKSFNVTFTNLISDNYQVSIDQSNSTNRLSVPYSSFSLGGNKGANTSVLTITYTNGGNTRDSGLIVFTPSVQGAASESLMIYVIDTVKNPPYIDIITRPFYNVPIGSKNCGNASITNYNGIPVTITSLAITGADAAEFSLNPAPSLPMTIDKNSTVLLPYCFTAPNTRHSDSRAVLEVTYHSDGTSDLMLRGYFYGVTESCVIFSPDSVQYGDLLAGGKAEGQVTITNTLDNAITLTGDSWEYGNQNKEFTLVGTIFPIQLAGKESKTLTFTWTPSSTATDYSVASYIINYTGAGDSMCTSVWLSFVGHIFDLTDTSSKAFKLFPNIKSALPIESEKTTTSKDFIFYNNTSNPVKVISVSVKDGTHFAVVSPTSSDLPVTLKPNDQMKVTISFDANTNGFYDDELDIVTENGLLTQPFSLQGMRKNGIAAGVSNRKAVQPLVMLSPNPSHGPVAIAVSDAEIRSIEIYDMLGTLVASEKNTNLWVWNGRTAGGEEVSAGTYFVRVSGFDEARNPFVQTTKSIRR